MDARQSMQATMRFADNIVFAYLGDLKDEELLVRPVPGANHIAWQLGHLITSEHGLIEAVSPGSMPPLPAGFEEKYTKETSKLDDPKAFHKKDEYIRLLKEQRTGTLKALEKTTEADLDKPGPEAYRDFLKTVGDVFALQGTHALMHAGQWAVTRRKLGRPPLF